MSSTTETTVPFVTHITIGDQEHVQEQLSYRHITLQILDTGRHAVLILDHQPYIRGYTPDIVALKQRLMDTPVDQGLVVTLDGRRVKITWE